MNAAASRASTVVGCRIVSRRRESSVCSARCVRQSSVRTEPSGAERAARRANALRGRVGEAQADPELQRPLAVASPSTSAGSAQPPSAEPAVGADADHAQVAPRRAGAGGERRAEREAVLARVVALQHELAGPAPGAALEDQRALDARPRVREPDQPDRVALAAEARGTRDERARALGARDAGQRGDAGEVGARLRDRGHVRAVRRAEQAVVGLVERRAPVQRDHQRAERERDDEPGQGGVQRPAARSARMTRRAAASISGLQADTRG